MEAKTNGQAPDSAEATPSSKPKQGAPAPDEPGGDANNGAREPAPVVSWWQKPHMIPLLVAIVAAMAPISTAIHGYYKSDLELKLAERKQVHLETLEREKQRHEIQSFYFKMAVENPDPVMRDRVLRFLLQDSDLKKWAEEEFKAVSTLLQVRKERDEAITALHAKEEQVASSDAERTQLIREAKQLRKKVGELNLEIERRTPQSTPHEPQPADLETQPETNQCKPGTIQMEFAEEREWSRCGQPTSTAYVGTSGRLYWTLVLDSRRVTCFCEPRSIRIRSRKNGTM